MILALIIEPTQKLILSKKLTNNSKGAKGYGNHLKLPNAFNWKAGRRSMLVDPITLEPVPYITIPGVLRLHEINEVPVKHRKERKTISKSFAQIPAKHEPRWPDFWKYETVFTKSFGPRINWRSWSSYSRCYLS